MSHFKLRKYTYICFRLLIIAIFIILIIQIVLAYITIENMNSLLKALPVLLWWTPFLPYTQIIECMNGQYRCLVTNNKTLTNEPEVYLFYGSYIENHDFPLPRVANISWALFHEESPKNYAPIMFEDTQTLFNITSTFSQNSDFPITTQYLTTSQFNLLTDKKYYVPVEQKNNYLKSIAPVLYIQSDCNTPIGRDYLVEELSKYVKIDSYGLCLKNKEFPQKIARLHSLDLYNEEYLHFISQYKFIIAFENAICDDYITEKLWRPLIVGAIPVYFGSPTVEAWLPNTNSAILVKHFDSLKAVAKYIDKVNANDTLYKSFIEHKILSKINNIFLKKQIMSDDAIAAFQCFVCKNVYEGSLTKKKVSRKSEIFYNCPKSAVNRKTTWEQHWDIGKCQSKALRLLIERGLKYKNDDFNEMWKTMLLENSC